MTENKNEVVDYRGKLTEALTLLTQIVVSLKSDIDVDFYNRNDVVEGEEGEERALDLERSLADTAFFARELESLVGTIKTEASRILSSASKMVASSMKKREVTKGSTSNCTYTTVVDVNYSVKDVDQFCFSMMGREIGLTVSQLIQQKLLSIHYPTVKKLHEMAFENGTPYQFGGIQVSYNDTISIRRKNGK